MNGELASGMLWYYRPPLSQEKIESARRYYREKYGRKPVRVWANPDDVAKYKLGLPIPGVTPGHLFLEHPNPKKGKS